MKAETGTRAKWVPVFSAKSTLGLGGWQIGGKDWGRGIDPKEAVSLVSRALEAGITFFDTAPSYGNSEEILGQALKPHRENVLIATKVGPHDDPESSVRRSLSKLGTDYVDLIQLHEPGPNFERQLERIAERKEFGAAKAIGLCNATSGQLRWAIENIGIDTYQGQYNLFDREAEQRHFPMCRDAGVAFIAYRPLASGLVGSAEEKRFADGDHRRDIYWFKGAELARRRVALGELEEIAKSKGVAVTALALAWGLQRPGVTAVLVGARTSQQLEQNLPAMGLELDEQDLDQIDSAIRRAYPLAKAIQRALDESVQWGERERFIVGHLDGNTAYEEIAATWNDSGDKQLTTAQVRAFVDALVERDLVAYE